MSSTINAMKSLAIMLQKNKTLTNINLEQCSFNENEAKLIAEIIENNRSITNINLFNNHINDRGIQVIASALAKNNTITSIDLCFNWSREEGAKSMIAMMEKNYSLIFVNFNCRDKNVDKYIQRNKLLQWNVVYSIIIDICIAMSALELPNYVLLEIVDWFPFWVSNFCKAKIITLRFAL